MKPASVHAFEEKTSRDLQYDSVADGHRVPGSEASAVKVSSLCNSFPRWLLKSTGSLRLFFQSVVNEPYESSSRTSTLDEAESLNRELWPIPIPYPEVFRKGAFGENHWIKKMVAMEVLVMSWLHLGCPVAAPSSMRVGSKLSRKQWEVVRYLLRISVDGNTPELVDVGSMGRSAMKFENIERALKQISESLSSMHGFARGYSEGRGEAPPTFDEAWFKCGSLMHSVDGHDVCVAKPIVSSRLQFPGEPAFDPTQFFDGPTCELYLHPLDHAADHRVYEGDVPSVKINAKVEEKLLLYRMLARCGRLRRLEVKNDRHPFVSGLFAVGKNELKDRLILDARPPNLLESPRTVWCSSMAAGSCLGEIQIEQDRILVASGLDLTDYFYQFVISQQRTARNRLAGSLTGDQAAFVFEDDQLLQCKEPILVALSTLAMGDLLACEFAQAAHLGLCLQHGVCSSNDLLAFRSVVPRSLTMVGIVIDDLVALEQILEHEVAAPIGELDSEKRIQRALDGYQQANLKHNPSKSFTRETCSRFWGAEIGWCQGPGSRFKLADVASFLHHLPSSFVGFLLCEADGNTCRLLGIFADYAKKVTLRDEPDF